MKLEEVKFDSQIKEQDIKQLLKNLKALKNTKGDCANVDVCFNCIECPLHYVGKGNCSEIRIGWSSKIQEGDYTPRDLEKWNHNRKLIKKALKKLDKDSN